MEIGISTASLFKKQFNEDALITFNEIDARVCEVFLESYCEYNEDYARLLNTKKGNLSVHSIHTLNTHFEPQLFSDNERAYSDAVKIYTDCLKVAKILGCHNYTMHGKARFKPNLLYNNYKEIGEYFEKLTELSSEYGVELCIENVAWAYYNKVGFFSSIKDYCPKLKTCFDVKQALDSGCDWRDYLTEMKGRINTVHLSDRDENGKTCLPSRGVLDFAEIFKRLRDAEFNGNMLVEVYNENFTKISELKESVEYLRDIKNRVFGK